MAEDRGKRLSCRAKNVNISRLTDASTGVVAVSEPGHGSSSGYFPENYKEDARHLVIYGIQLLAYSFLTLFPRVPSLSLPTR